MLDVAIAAGFAQGCAVLICDPSERASQFLACQPADTIDAKGLFVLDKLHVRPREEILEQARGSLVSTLRTGRMLHLELGKSAPSFGEIGGTNHFPSLALFTDGFGRNKPAHAALGAFLCSSRAHWFYTVCILFCIGVVLIMMKLIVPPDETGTRADFWRQYFDDRLGNVRLPGEWGSQGHG